MRTALLLLAAAALPAIATAQTATSAGSSTTRSAAGSAAPSRAPSAQAATSAASPAAGAPGGSGTSGYVGSGYAGTGTGSTGNVLSYTPKTSMVTSSFGGGSTTNLNVGSYAPQSLPKSSMGDLGSRSPDGTQSVAAAVGGRLGGSRINRVGGRLGGGSDTLPLDIRDVDPRDTLENRVKAFNHR